MKNTIRAAVGQTDVKLFQKEQNLRKMETMAREARDRAGAELMLFPEAALAGYCFESREEALETAESLRGLSVERMRRLSRETGMILAFGMAELGEGRRLYNSVVCCLPGGGLFAYRKSHRPLLGLDRFAEDGGELPVISTDYGPVGMICCYDMRFPETVRCEALRGAGLILHATNLPPAGRAYPEFLNRARACENRVFILSANRVGTERGVSFIGRSQIIGPDGSVLEEMKDGEGWVCRELSLSEAEEKDIIVRRGLHEMHLFRDRRPELYGAITEKEE